MRLKPVEKVIQWAIIGLLAAAFIFYCYHFLQNPVKFSLWDW